MASFSKEAIPLTASTLDPVSRARLMHEFLAVAVISDALHYFLHRLFHMGPFYWVHKAHHASVKTVVCSNAMDNDPLDLLLVVELPVALASWLGGRCLTTQLLVMFAIGLWGAFIHQFFFGNHMDHHKNPKSSYAPIFPWLDLVAGTTSSHYSATAQVSIYVLLALVIAFLGLPYFDASWASSCAVPLSIVITFNFLAIMAILNNDRRSA